MTDIDHNALNKKVAEVIFGLVPCKASYHADDDDWCYADPEYPNSGASVRGYSIDPDQMQKVIEHFTDQDAVVTIIYGPGGGARATIDVPVMWTRGDSFSAGADDAPTALSMAALLSRGQLSGVWSS